ncbi:MAG: glycosyltransferase family 2 protein [Candidatus Sericytochromatia bacterium]
MKTAIVSTIINSENIIDSFINYHLNIGFDYFIFFIDDNSENIINYLTNKYGSLVILVKNDINLDAIHKEMELYMYFYEFKKKEVMARQILNTKVSLNICLELKIDWLLHIDIDELLYLTSEKSIKEYLNKVSYYGYETVTFNNLEALPEKTHIVDYFKEVRLFKKNAIYYNKYDEITTGETRKEFYMAYQNGKSIVKVSYNTEVNSVHHFVGKGKPLKTYKDYSHVILHYCCCGYENFIKKYKTLGDFSDYWFNKDIIKNSLKFHIESRNIIKEGIEERINNFYLKNVIKYESPKIKEFLQKGILIKINIPKTMFLKPLD